MAEFFRPASHQVTYQDGSRVYLFDGSIYPSVTTILDMLDKPALVRWAAKMAAEYAVERKEHLYPLPDDEAVDLIKQAPWRESGRAARMGTAVHDAAEAWVNKQPIEEHADPTVRAKIEQFLRFCDSSLGVELHAAEVACYNDTVGYAGTLDLMATIAGEGPMPVDIKTGKNIYPEHFLQITGYERTEFYDWDGQKRPMPNTGQAAVLHLSAKSWRLVPIKVTDPLAGKFFSLVGAFGWKEEAQQATGTPHVG